MATRLAAFASLVVALNAFTADKNPIEAAQQAAKEAAGFEFLGTLARTCFLPPSRSEDFRDVPAPYVTDPGKAPPRSSWYADPAQVFDNLYFVGGKVHSSWALKTREGIILFDTIYPYNSEELIVGGMQKLGLDPSDIKYLRPDGHPACRQGACAYQSVHRPASAWPCSPARAGRASPKSFSVRIGLNRSAM